MPFVPITGPIVADTVYANNALVAKDVGATFPEVTPITADLQVMGTLSLPVWQLLEDMELAITKIGTDMGLANMMKAEAMNLEFRWVHTSTDANGITKNVGCKAFFKAMPKVLPGVEFAVGEASENEATFTILRYQVFIDGQEAWLIDRLASIVRIAGNDYTTNVNSLL